MGEQLNTVTEHTLRSSKEADDDLMLKNLLQGSPVFDSNQWSMHSSVFLKRQALSRLLYLDAIYREIIEVPGVIIEFGVQYGATLATLMNLRGIYEPYNHSRHIFGFDTFSGFASVDQKDGAGNSAGDYAVSQDGDISATLPRWLEENQHAVVAMAIFDVDVYKPTLDAINAIKPRLLKNSILVFDDFSAPNFPGETIAVREALGLNNLELKRGPYQTYCCWGRFGG